MLEKTGEFKNKMDEINKNDIKVDEIFLVIYMKNTYK